MTVRSSTMGRHVARRPLLEVLEDRRLMAASLAPIANLTVPAQQGYTLPLIGSGTTDAQTFAVTSSNPDVAASIAQGPFWTIPVQYTDSNNPANNFSGLLTFQLFNNLAPNEPGPQHTVSQIQVFTNDGYYNGKPFTRVATGFPAATDYVVQAGAPNPNGTGSSGQPGTPFANESFQPLAFTGTDQLGMANAGGTNSNDTQFFITTGSPNAELGYNYTIFGQLVSGQETLTRMTQVPVQPNPALGGEDSSPVNPLVMGKLSLSATNPNGTLILDTTQARPGETATITVTATDPTDGSSVSQSFTVSVGPYQGPMNPSINFRPFATPMTAQAVINTPATLTLAGQSGYPGPDQPMLGYTLISAPSHGTISQFNSGTGSLVYTPDPGFTGTDSFQYAVQASGPRLAPDAPPSNPATVTITVAPQILATTTAVVSSASTPVFGQAVTFTATVAPAAPGIGAITFTIDGTSSTVPLDLFGQAQLTTATLGPGPHTITAAYTGGGSFLPSRSGPIQQVVAQADTQSILIPRVLRNRHGKLRAVRLTDQVEPVAPGAGAPTGTVTVFVDGRPLLTEALSGGTAVVTLKPKRALKKTITIAYSGDARFRASQSPGAIIVPVSVRAMARPMAAFLRRDWAGSRN